MSDLPPILHYADIEAEIASEHYFTAAQAVGLTTGETPPASLDLLTICALVFKNGTAVSASTLAPAGGFDAQKGRAVARHKAIRTLFMKSGVRELLGIGPKPTSGKVELDSPEAKSGNWK